MHINRPTSSTDGFNCESWGDDKRITKPKISRGKEIGRVEVGYTFGRADRKQTEKGVNTNLLPRKQDEVIFFFQL